MPLGASRLSFLAYQAAEAAGRTAITLTAQQDVQVSTAQSKFGGASAYFDGGTDDYILVDHTGFSHAYSDNFTYECWFRLDSLPSLFTMLATGSTRGDYLSIYNKSGTWTVTAPVSNGSSVYTQIRNIGFTPSINTWYHVALVKDGTSLKMFFDGTELTVNNGSAGTMSADKGWNGISRIGDWAGGSNYATTGYIDEVRWSSTARYSTSFTPSTTAFSNDSDTLLLVHMDGVDGSTTFTDDTVTPLGAGGYITDLTVSGTDYRFHVFDSQSTDDFVVSGSSDVDVILIGGGGGSRTASFYGGGGGGAGQVLLQTSVAVTAQTYTMTVGGGGPGGAHNASLADGGTTTAFGYSAIGGDPASSVSSNTTAQSGGGSGNGFSGGSGANSGTNSYDSGGGGAGATQNGDSGFLSSSAPRASCGTGGNGYDLTSFIGSGNTLTLRNSEDIESLEVARGGNGARDSSSDVTSFGSGANALYNLQSAAGTGGAVIIRYQL